ncbi:hypothetical protein [Prolixibacter sp. NT017]|nr:hypothetical protein [Prolixibacter sp. NT017]
MEAIGEKGVEAGEMLTRVGERNFAGTGKCGAGMEMDEQSG